MDKYEQVAIVGEGSYGIVMKCKHKDTGQIVAIKKFLETEEDATVRRMALREIRMLKKLKHENLVTMIEVFRHKKRFYLVFEYLNGTLLDEMEKVGGALDEDTCRQRIYQVIRGVHFCHTNNVIHRDIKPENVLVSSRGVVKLCDFGFARLVSINGEQCTEYVATRWYRAPELLVADHAYGAAVDVWAIGCLYSEMMTGDPLFPGDSDIDQLFLIIKMLGSPCVRHQHLMMRNSHLRNIIKSASSDTNVIYKTFTNWDRPSVDFLSVCLQMNPVERPSSDELMQHDLFMQDNFPQRYLPLLREEVLHELADNPLLERLKHGIINATDQADIKEVRLKKSVLAETAAQWRINVGESKTARAINDSVATKHALLELTADKNSIYSMIKEKVHQEASNKLRSESASKTKGANATTPLSTPPQLSDLKITPTHLQSNNVLHPSVHNICFCKEIIASKRSPNILQSSSTRSNFSQIPLVNPKAQFLKRLERNVVLETVPAHIGSGNFGVNWLHTTGITNHRKKTKSKNDDFTLPSVPGAILTPKQIKKKPHFRPQDLLTQSITPRTRSSMSQKSSASSILVLL